MGKSLEERPMIRGSVLSGLILSAVLLAACQTYTPTTTPVAATTPMDGNWASADGVFVATFQGGRFTSRFTQTNEILAQGTYTVSGGNVTMQWISVQAQQQRSANCTFTAADSVQCSQAGGGSFELNRSA
jgi:hypothetical protein